MNNSKTGIRIRFVEYDYLFLKIQRENPNLAMDEIVSILSELNDLCDVSFVFYPKSSGLFTKVYDNITEQEVTLDGLNNVALQFYIEQVKAFSLLQQLSIKENIHRNVTDSKARENINKLKNMFSDWKLQKGMEVV